MRTLNNGVLYTLTHTMTTGTVKKVFILPWKNLLTTHSWEEPGETVDQVFYTRSIYGVDIDFTLS